MLKCVIHNSERRDRWATFQREVEVQGIEDILVVPSVHESPRAPANINKAHKNCIRKAIELGEKMILIMEDDVRFLGKGAYVEFISRMLHLPRDWDMYLSGVYDGKIEEGSEGIAVVRDFSGLHCYVVHERFYDKFLGVDDRINIDRALSGRAFSRYAAHLCYPMVALQHDGYSDNVRRQTNYNSLIEGRFKLWSPK